MQRDFYLGLAATSLLVLIGHWVPKPVHVPVYVSRIASYLYGVATMLAGEAVWLWSSQAPLDGATAWNGLLGYAAVAIAASVIAYVVDAVFNLMIRFGVIGVNDGSDICG
jgi:hypothetical protein